MQTFDNFMDDLSALVSRLPTNELEAVLWLNSLQYNCVMAAEAIQRNHINAENFKVSK